MSESFDYDFEQNFDYTEHDLDSRISDETSRLLSAVPKYLLASEQLQQISRNLDVDINLINYAYRHDDLPSVRLRFVQRFPQIIEKFDGVNVEEMIWYIPEAFSATADNEQDADIFAPPDAILSVLILEDGTEAHFFVSLASCIRYEKFDDLDLRFMIDDNGKNIISAKNSLLPQDNDEQYKNILAHLNILAALRQGNQSRNDGTSA